MTARLAVVVAVAALAATGFASGNATASDATPAQVAALAARAGTDEQALATLREVDRIGGRPVDLGTALDAEGPALEARLRVLAASGNADASADPGVDPRASAGAILSERRFTGSDVPRPLHRPLAWLGRKLHSIYDAVVGPLPGGPTLFWTLVAAAVVALAVLGALQLARRRAGRTLELGGRRARGAAEDPRELEREADEAERSGDFEQALRLRFRAGLLRLARSEAIPRRQSLTNGEIARRLHSRGFGQLATDFDEVVYGRRKAGGEDVQRARETWPEILEEADRR